MVRICADVKEMFEISRGANFRDSLGVPSGLPHWHHTVSKTEFLLIFHFVIYFGYYWKNVGKFYQTRCHDNFNINITTFVKQNQEATRK